ncbi:MULTISPECIES: GNAT family N-acetyltransferase [Clostridium]|uniref:N-acetyltransferase n=1 Tax=Clostridium beijerinckii TaxID=1520 RepID=A0A1S8SSM4_CLOBE|nr:MULTISPECIES: GNAT family N-acetyltransferase [Clostridium]MBA8936553.1 phosphinothricin acetyltransferase [Clostridium beijerinckii]MBN7575262.1 N-acetyltransferase [Clostridium beijerinckii]MBN7577735.1 N-acetyltransferase [Clostridium beijerinckii]MBN7585026.1 N-acetyltransferase [Clostridium beijerinckii]MBO0520911.1 N-acetyltransferase [Clostridium beijerinckii]
MIREATEKDLADILEIYNDAILNTTAIYDYTAHNLEERKQWFDEKKKDGCPLLVFEKDDKVVGFATYGSFRTYPAFKYTIEHSVYVHKDCRNLGIGKILLKELIDAANRDEYATMVACIDSLNEGSIKIHEKFGFKYSGTVTKAGYKFGKWLDLVFYQLDLTGPKHPIEI